MKYGVKIYEGKEIIEQRIIETKDEKELEKIIGSKTHRFWNGGDWTEPRFVIKVEIIESYLSISSIFFLTSSPI